MVVYTTEYDTKKQSSNGLNGLDSFYAIWKDIFLWCFFPLLCTNLLAAVIAFATLRKHKYGRFISGCVLLYGSCRALLYSSITSVAVAYVLYNATFELENIHTLVCGLFEMSVYLLFAFSILMPSL